MSSSAADDERTQAWPAPTDSHALPLGTRLGEFELTAKLGEGGFSIVYLAWDHSLDCKVALKEYMPGSISARAGHATVSPRSERHREAFEAGLRSFVNEAKLLRRFDHPALVKVYRFWEAHGTAYMVMPLYEGLTLKETVRARTAPPDEAWLMQLLAPLTEALQVIHAEQCYHRDIAPDNVILLAGSGLPLLLDFGAARRVIGDMTQALTIILKPGYAPVEQYAEVPGMRQGPWTDVYALAAVVYWCITGKTPPPSVGRMIRDTHVPLLTCAAGRYSEPFLRAVDRALVVMPEQRTQTIDDFRREIGLVGRAPAPPAEPTRWEDPQATVIRPPQAPEIESAVAATVAAEDPGATIRHEPRAATVAPPPRKGSKAPMWAAGAACVVLAVAGTGWWLSQKPPAPAPTAAASPATPPASVPAAATIVEPAPVAETAAPSPTASPPLETAPAAIPAPPAPRPERKPPHPNRLDTAKSEPAAEAKPNAAECAHIFQRFSLGESSPALLERVKSLNCR